MTNIVCKKWFLFQVEIKKKSVIENVVYVLLSDMYATDQAAPDKSTIPLDRITLIVT